MSTLWLFIYFPFPVFLFTILWFQSYKTLFTMGSKMCFGWSDYKSNQPSKWIVIQLHKPWPHVFCSVKVNVSWCVPTRTLKENTLSMQDMVVLVRVYQTAKFCPVRLTAPTTPLHRLPVADVCLSCHYGNCVSWPNVSYSLIKFNKQFLWTFKTVIWVMLLSHNLPTFRKGVHSQPTYT